MMGSTPLPCERATHAAGTAGLSRWVLIGHSHCNAVAAAAARRSTADRDRFAVVNLNRLCGRHEVLTAEPVPRLNAVVVEAIANAAAGATSVRYVSMVGGNAHSVVGMMQHQRPFDFVVPGHESLGRIPGAELLSYEYVRESLQHLCTAHFAQFRVLRDHVGALAAHIDTPPPVEDEALIRPALGEFFRRLEQSGSSAISPAVLRYKLWLTHAAVWQQFCRDEQVPYVGPPPEAFDERGYLRGSLMAEATHGNAAFGELVLRRLDALFGAEAHASL